NASAGWVYGQGRATNMFRVNYNHHHVATTNLFSSVTNVDALAGILGVSADPFNWGLPGINFTSFGGLSDPIARRELDQTYTFSDTISWNHAKHHWRFGAADYDFRANFYHFFAQDDWRFRSNLSFNFGLRYEYNGPYTEANNHIANLDVAPGFNAAAPVLPGATGPYNGVSPNSLIRPDRNDWAPRLGMAWKPEKKMVVRAGYGINYNLAQYGAMIQNFA